jgi:hypothetical protein
MCLNIVNTESFEVRHPRCVSNKSNYKVYAYNQPKAKTPPPPPNTCEISHLHLLPSTPAPYTPPTDACISDW